MLDLATLDAKKIARILLLEDHREIDPENIGNDWNGMVDEADEYERIGDTMRANVTFSEIASDECSAFPNGLIEASSTLSRGENDGYRSGVVVVFDKIDGRNCVILDGAHSGTGNSDESHEGYFSGTMTVAPLSRMDEILAEALSDNRRDELRDMASRLADIACSLNKFAIDEIIASPLWREIHKMNRIIAGA